MGGITLMLLACAKPREQAPAALDRMLLDSYRDWEDTVASDAHMDELSSWLEREGDTESAWEGLQVANLDEPSLVSVEIPAGADLSLHRGVSTTFQSAFPAANHAGLAVEKDQTWTDPSTFERYDREISEGDSESFAAGSGVLRTVNTIEKSGAFGIRIPYVLRKDYRWNERGDTLLVRWWLDEPGCSENGKNCVLQSFGLELLADQGDPAAAMRILVNWIEVVTEADSLLTEEARIGLIASGNQDLLLATEEVLAER